MGNTSGICVVRREFESLALGDKRLEARAAEIAARLAAAPEDSFPEQMASDAELEGLYRFFSNPKATIEALLGGHIRATHARMSGHSVVRIVHDTSSFRFEGEREGLGIIRGDRRGFFGHTSLALSADEEREPLGVVALTPYVHADAVSNRGKTNSQRVMASRRKPRDEKESSRWEKQAIAVSANLPKGTKAIHMMDQEGDDFHIFAELQNVDVSFVIRADPKRKTYDHLQARDVLAKQPANVFRAVRLTERKDYKHRTKSHPIRPEREASLELRWGVINLRRGESADLPIRELSVTAVHVLEPNPPNGEDAIEWMLLTSEPVHTAEDAGAIVDHYRARWIIEEYFKALKTGCAIEKRQLTTFDGLTSALALFVPIAWQLLVLRHLGRAVPERPAGAVFDSEQLLMLRAVLLERSYPLVKEPTVRDVMLGIARLGGHIRNNGEPGWLVLGRGYTRFLDAESVWRLARRSDQS